MSGREEAIDTSWRVHAALADWTGKAETKASFVLAIESALLGGVVALSEGNRRLANIQGDWLLLGYWGGVAFLGMGVLCVAWAVFPRLRGGMVKAESATNFIYFGHLRHYRSREPELQRLIEESDVLPVLTHQLVEMSDIAWKKHWWLQRSIVSAILGSAVLAITAGLK